MTVRNNRESPAERDHDRETSCYWEEEDLERRLRRKGYVHSQVMRIREEDSHMGQDLLDDVLKAGAGAGVDHNNYGLMIKNMVAAASSPVIMNDRVVVLLTRPLLPSSPLSRKTTVN